jgi:hypothetical protein
MVVALNCVGVGTHEETAGCFFLLSSFVSAQTNYATLGGTVGDASGALIPGVTITASNTETGIVTTVLSNETARISLPRCSPGSTG